MELRGGLRRVPFLAALTLSSGALCLACGGSAQPPADAAPPPPPPPPPAEHVPPPVEEVEEEPQVKILSNVGFKTPESVYYDKKRDVYLVSNINGSPHGKDDNGFISKITPEGDITLKFIDGASESVTLNAPKGMTISDDTLYVADIDHVRMFDAETGEAKGEIQFAGASMINDLSTGKKGAIYVTDTGVNEKWETDGKDAVYVVKDGKPKKIFSHKTKLGNPNGIVAGDGGAWVVTGTGEILWISDQGKIQKAQKISGGSNDGVVHTKDGRILVSSWEDGAVYAGTPGGEFHKEISGLDTPADIGIDCTRNRLLIPLFKKDEVVLHTLAAPAAEGDETRDDEDASDGDVE